MMALNIKIVDMELDKKCLFIEEKHMKLEDKEEVTHFNVNLVIAKNEWGYSLL